MLTTLYSLFIAIPRVRAQCLGRRGVAVWLNYCRLKLSPSRRRRHPEVARVRFLGFEMEVFDYQNFVYLFEEIFVHGIYRFEAKIDEPHVARLRREYWGSDFVL